MKKRVLAISLGLVIMFSSVLSASANYQSYNWYYPLSPNFTYIFSRHNNPNYYSAHGVRHFGFDIQASNILGTTVYAAQTGTVVSSAFELNGGLNYGYMISVRSVNNDPNGQPLHYTYAHLLEAPKSINGSYILSGYGVVRGSIVGKVGSSGNSSGPHLHMEITKNGSWYHNGIIANTVNPYHFYSHRINFTGDVTLWGSSGVSPIATDDSDYNKMNRSDELYYINTSLIAYVGEVAFNNWLKQNNAKVNSNLTVVDFLDDFSISTPKAKQIVESYDVPFYMQDEKSEFYDYALIEKLR